MFIIRNFTYNKHVCENFDIMLKLKYIMLKLQRYCWSIFRLCWRIIGFSFALLNYLPFESDENILENLDLNLIMDRNVSGTLVEFLESTQNELINVNMSENDKSIIKIYIQNKIKDLLKIRIEFQQHLWVLYCID